MAAIARMLSTNPTAHAPMWSVRRYVAYEDGVNAVSCPSTAVCRRRLFRARLDHHQSHRPVADVGCHPHRPRNNAALRHLVFLCLLVRGGRLPWQGDGLQESRRCFSHLERAR
jgi:hypothetical protein